MTVRSTDLGLDEPAGSREIAASRPCEGVDFPIQRAGAVRVGKDE